MASTRFRSRIGHWWRKEIRPLLILALIVFSIRSSLADWSDVPTGSMKPTILEGDRVYVNKLAYDLKVDRKSTRLNSSHSQISYAVFCLKKKKKKYTHQ